MIHGKGRSARGGSSISLSTIVCCSVSRSKVGSSVWVTSSSLSRAVEGAVLERTGRFFIASGVGGTSSLLLRRRCGEANVGCSHGVFLISALGGPAVSGSTGFTVSPLSLAGASDLLRSPTMAESSLIITIIKISRMEIRNSIIILSFPWV
ncbi:hypothetical protein HKBW3S03_00940 [Candidatus Hakubella thermalkaliphila]|uniref:Uncharacterized protein n=1 Tax=Candidatus Hakubella thermalkaliphila TaxID=2754717 RepID=A0A6V8NGQ8_9ACTN|nr:hypothetical protein HKBW3S03_00940 [Candidatus Hakubella thermalkaliphila]GFP36668.1 hypothetical protein HKBW3S44_00349 [Candidatus Hakubella thermalkaliphila]GFP39186.1 hypothetical protein HKBW3S47_00886 [Candidatus Hakubella thermalkaliphila]